MKMAPSVEVVPPPAPQEGLPLTLGGYVHRGTLQQTGTLPESVLKPHSPRSLLMLTWAMAGESLFPRGLCVLSHGLIRWGTEGTHVQLEGWLQPVWRCYPRRPVGSGSPKPRWERQVYCYPKVLLSPRSDS